MKPISMLTLLLGIILSACMPANPVPGPLPTQAACPDVDNWSLEFSRSGGFAGLTDSIKLTHAGEMTYSPGRSNEILVLPVPDESIRKISELVAETCSLATSGPGEVCPDCFVYTVIINSNGMVYTGIETDLSLPDSSNSDLYSELLELLQQASRTAP